MEELIKAMTECLEAMEKVQKSQIELIKMHSIKLVQIDETLKLGQYVPFEVAKKMVEGELNNGK